MFLFSKAVRPALRLKQLPMQWASGELFLRVEAAEV